MHTLKTILIRKKSGFNFELRYSTLDEEKGTIRTIQITDYEKVMNGDSLNSTFTISINDIDLDRTEMHNKEQIKRFFKHIIDTL